MASTKPRLLVVGGPARGRELVLEGVQASIGRGQDNDLVLADLSVSRHHLTIYVDEGGIHARDHGSGNGTLVNGEPLGGGDERTLRDGDELELGHSVLRLVHPVPTPIARPMTRAHSAELAPEAAPAPAPRPPVEPIALTVPIVRTREPGPGVGLPAALVAVAAALAGAAWLALPRRRAAAPDAPPPPRPVVVALELPDAPPPPEPPPAPRPRRVSVDKEAQALYAARRFGDAVDLLRQAGGRDALARDFAAVGAGLARGDATLAADPAAALAAYQEALAADARSGAGAHAAFLRDKVARAAAPAAAGFLAAGQLEPARAACDLAERGGQDVGAVRDGLEAAAARLFAEARRLPAADAAPIYRRILRIVPPSSQWHPKALAQLGE